MDTTTVAELKPGQRFITPGGRTVTVKTIRPADLEFGKLDITTVEDGPAFVASYGWRVEVAP